jgi:hypothetical protein
MYITMFITTVVGSCGHYTVKLHTMVSILQVIVCIYILVTVHILTVCCRLRCDIHSKNVVVLVCLLHFCLRALTVSG